MQSTSTMDDGTESLFSPEAQTTTQLLLTALAGLSLINAVAPSALRAAGLPPIPAVLRRCRPYAHAAVVGLWIWNRARNGAGGTAGGDGIPGLLDESVLLLRRAAVLASGAAGGGGRIPLLLVSWASVLLNDILGLILLRSVLSGMYVLSHLSLCDLRDSIVQRAFEFAADHVGPVRREMAKEEAKMIDSIDGELKDPERTITRTLPMKGTDPEELMKLIEKRAEKEDAKWRDGLVSGTVYSGEERHTELLNRVYAAYSWSNPLHTDVWPSVNQFEAEVVAVTASLLNGGDPNVVGSMTSGGTESIVLAVRSAREHYGRRRGVERPEIVCCTTAHAGLDKACDMMGIRMVRLEPDPTTFRVRPADVERAVTRNTILVYSSAPNFPQGVIDPIPELSDIAGRHGVGLHVDACLGGFVLPFARKLGYDVPDFDFGCPGVTSMSVDTHKYGYATKGTSVVLYRNKALRRAQYFAYAHWTGGLYATPTIAGSRAGGLLACAWASMMSLGEEGYLSRVKSIIDTTRTIAGAVAEIPGLRLMGGMPGAMIVCFGSEEFDIYRVGDKMSKRGWSLNTLQRPACIHLCVTLQTVPHAEKFVAELKGAVEEVVAEGNSGKKTGNAAIYGLAGSLPPGPVASLLKCYTDAMLTP